MVWPTGEGKQWTPDGKGVVILGGAVDAGNVDDIVVDVSGRTGDNLIPGSPFRAHRVTGNLDYDEDMVYVGAAVYAQYADKQVRNVSNQNWLVAVEDDLKRQNGIPLFVQDDPNTPGSMKVTDGRPEACPAGMPTAPRSRSGSPATAMSTACRPPNHESSSPT